MKTQSPDTHPDMERMQLELLRKATVAQRFGLVRSLPILRDSLAGAPFSVHIQRQMTKKWPSYLLPTATVKS